MSIQSWREEFMPTSAEDFRGKELSVENLIEATQHSLNKWKGVNYEDLKKHGARITEHSCYHRYHYLIDNKNETFHFCADNCALCMITNIECENECENCPLFKANGHDCNMQLSGYSEFLETGDSHNMVIELERTLEYLSLLNS